MEKITYTNHIRIGDKRMRLDELPEREKENVVNSMIYRSLLTVPNSEVIQTT